MTDEMTSREREQLIRLVKARARQAEREAEMREKVLLAEVQNELTAEYERHDALWADAVTVAEEVAAKANAEIAAACVDLGIPARHAPRIETYWRARSPDYSDRNRRAELRKLAETRLAALTKTAKTAIQGAALEAETQLVMGGLQSGEAQQTLASMPTVEQLMPPLTLDDLGVTHWQPPEDAAGQLTTPLTPADRKRRRILRAIEANPGASDRKIAAIANADHKTVATYRRERGEIPAITGDSATAESETTTGTEPAGEEKP
jgi:hypothetical protein